MIILGDADVVQNSTSGHQPEDARKLDAVRTILSDKTWELVECQTPEQKFAFRWIINNYHKYMKYSDTPGRRINWLVYYYGELVGAFGINGAAFACAVRDRYIGWNTKQKLKHLKELANNYRFCMLKTSLPTSQLLSVACKVAQKAWKRRYGDELVLMETFIKPPFKGTVYKAAGWIELGMTKGYSISKAGVTLWLKQNTKRGEIARKDINEAIRLYGVKKDGLQRKRYVAIKTEPKMVFVKPLVSEWREVLTS